MIKLIISDIDGTLLKNGEKHFDSSVFEVIEKLHERDILFAAASGRGYHDLENLFSPVQSKMAFVCSDGAMTVKGKNILDVRLMSPESVVALVRKVDEMDGCEFIVYGRQHIYVKPKTDSFRAFVKERFSREEHILDGIDRLENTDDDFLKVAIKADAGIECYEDEFLAWKDVFELVYNANIWMEFVAPNVSKVTGVDVLCRYLGITPENVMAFGDGGNDIKILGYVGTAYARDYASDKVKQAADYITDDVIETIKEKILKL